MNANIKAVLFDLGGVVLPQPQKQIALYAKKLGIPPRFLPEVFMSGAPNNAFCKLEQGELTITEFYKDFEAEVKQKAKQESVLLPNSFSVKDLFDSFLQSGSIKNNQPINNVNLEMLRASTILRKNGILTGVITNNWIDEINKESSSEFMKVMKSYFNEVVESKNMGLRKPDSKIYELTCQKLGVRPQECIFLDDIGQNLKSASQLGIKGIKVDDPRKAIEQLEELTGIKLLGGNGNHTFPAPSDPATVAHGYVMVKPGIKIHFVESGDGPVVILLHGFPDCWYGWRHQISALASKGYRVIALDQRGYGESSSPDGVENYCHEELCSDVITVMDKLGIAMATVVGHDWGGSLAWNLALKFPDRFKGVCGVNTPFFKINPSKNPLHSMYKNPGAFDYQLYIQELGVADKELDENIERSLNSFFQGFDTKLGKAISTRSVRKRGGFLAGLPQHIPRSSFLSATDLKTYVRAFEHHGFSGPLNWYRNYERNWKWLRVLANREITMPALMVTTSHDPVLKAEYTYGMEERVLNLKRLHIKNCTHWTMQEKPYELNAGLIEWLGEIHGQNIKSML